MAIKLEGGGEGPNVLAISGGIFYAASLRRTFNSCLGIPKANKNYIIPRFSGCSGQISFSSSASSSSDADIVNLMYINNHDHRPKEQRFDISCLGNLRMILKKETRRESVQYQNLIS